MRFSTLIAVCVVLFFGARLALSALGGNAVVLLGILGFLAVYAFFRNVVNAD